MRTDYTPHSPTSAADGGPASPAGDSRAYGVSAIAADAILKLLRTADQAGADPIQIGTAALGTIWHERDQVAGPPSRGPARYAAFARATAELYTAIVCPGETFEQQETATVLADLITDCGHLAHESGADPEAVLDRARRYLDEEIEDFERPGADTGRTGPDHATQHDTMLTAPTQLNKQHGEAIGSTATQP